MSKSTKHQCTIRGSVLGTNTPTLTGCTWEVGKSIHWCQSSVTQKVSSFPSENELCSQFFPLEWNQRLPGWNPRYIMSLAYWTSFLQRFNLLQHSQGLRHTTLCDFQMKRHITYKSCKKWKLNVLHTAHVDVSLWIRMLTFMTGTDSCDKGFIIVQFIQCVTCTLHTTTCIATDTLKSVQSCMAPLLLCM